MGALLSAETTRAAGFIPYVEPVLDSLEDYAEDAGLDPDDPATERAYATALAEERAFYDVLAAEVDR